MKMKRILSLLLVCLLLLPLVSCTVTEETGDSAESTVETGETQAPAEGSGTGRVLVAYFSWADNAVLTEDVDAVTSPSVVPPGNVQQLAGWVQEETGGDLFSIQVTEPYPDDWDECLDRANQERSENARPELARNVENMEQYDTVFLGYPNWWYGVPMALLSFLEQNDFSGKQVYLFCSHGTGGLANSVELITDAVPGAEISENIFDCYEEDASASREEIQNWVAELGYSASKSAETEETDTMEETARQIAVRSGNGEIIYELNDSKAAADLLAQLPLTMEAEDFSTNEKIFYPPRELDTADAPLAEGGAGTLAYYAPWGDVVMFYGDYSENASLFELGQAVSGQELISGLSGMITIEAVE